MAIETNDDGNSLSVYRVNAGPVWVGFSLGKDSGDRISRKRMIIVRIDKEEPFDIGKFARLTNEFFTVTEWHPRSVSFLAWEGDKDEDQTLLVDLLSGETVLVRYYLTDGSYKDTRFSLKEAASVIAGAIGIPLKDYSEARKRNARLKDLYNQEVAKCPNIGPGDLMNCKSPIDWCLGRNSADPDGFAHCMATLRD